VVSTIGQFGQDSIGEQSPKRLTQSKRQERQHQCYRLLEEEGEAVCRPRGRRCRATRGPRLLRHQTVLGLALVYTATSAGFPSVRDTLTRINGIDPTLLLLGTAAFARRLSQPLYTHVGL
jgi:hypothetical protein